MAIVTLNIGVAPICNDCHASIAWRHTLHTYPPFNYGVEPTPQSNWRTCNWCHNPTLEYIRDHGLHQTTLQPRST